VPRRALSRRRRRRRCCSTTARAALEVGVAFSRFQTRYFRGKYSGLDARVVSYGPCQTPTLGFCVARHLEVGRWDRDRVTPRRVNECRPPFDGNDKETSRRGRLVRLRARGGVCVTDNVCGRAPPRGGGIE
jgi:hypothetical protein